MDAATLDPIVQKHSAYLADWAYVTPELKRVLPDADDVCYVEDKTVMNSKMQVAIFGLSASPKIDANLNSEYTSNEKVGETM